MVHKQRPAAREDVAGGLDHTTERWCTFAHRWHTVGTQLARANSGLGACQVLSWRAPSGKLARQLPIWRAPSPLLAHAKSGFGAPTYHLARAKAMPSQCLLISSTACCPDSDSPRPLPPACAWGQAGAQRTGCLSSRPCPPSPPSALSPRAASGSGAETPALPPSSGGQGQWPARRSTHTASTSAAVLERQCCSGGAGCAWRGGAWGVPQ